MYRKIIKKDTSNYWVITTEGGGRIGNRDEKKELFDIYAIYLHIFKNLMRLFLI